MLTTIKETRKAYEVNDGHGARRFVGRRWLDKCTLSSEHSSELGHFHNFIEFDGFRGALEFAGIRLAFLFQANTRRVSRDASEMVCTNVPIKHLLELHFLLLFICFGRRGGGGVRWPSLRTGRLVLRD